MKQALRKGDIIVFKSQDDWLSKAIAWFTESDVSHAAMVYSENSIVEVNAHGIGVHEIEASDGGDVYLMRLDPQQDPAPLIRSADIYLKSRIHYDFPAIFILAGQLIQRRIIPNEKLLAVANRIFGAAGLILDQYLQHAVLHYPRGGQAMICSELVYQIYYDCGTKYQIQIDSEEAKQKERHKDSPNAVCILELLSQNPTSAFATGLPPELPDPEVLSRGTLTIAEEDLLARDVWQALQQPETEIASPGGRTEEELLSAAAAILPAADHFLSGLSYFMKLMNCNLPLDAMFVTPADLVYHAPNLQQVDTLSLKRLKD